MSLKCSSSATKFISYQDLSAILMQKKKERSLIEMRINEKDFSLVALDISLCSCLLVVFVFEHIRNTAIPLRVAGCFYPPI